MPTYAELAELARICWQQARLAQAEDVALALRKMAREYQQQAAELDGGNLPDLGGVNDNTPVV